MPAVARPHTAPPRWFYRNLARVLVGPVATEGTLSIVEMIGTQGEMPPLHVHHREDEIERARWLAVSTPAGFASFVEAASDPADYADVPPDERPVDMDRLLAEAEAHGIEIIGPPGTMP